MKIVSYLKKNGLKHTFDVIYMYKIDIIIQKVIKVFFGRKPLQNTYSAFWR